MTFRGTPGSQLFKINGGIQVAVDPQAAVITEVNTPAQVQCCLDAPTLRTTLRRGVKRVGQDDLTAIPLALIEQLPPELVESHIHDGLRQVMVLQQSASIQDFQYHG
jgi:hypothetical protein